MKRFVLAVAALTIGLSACGGGATLTRQQRVVEEQSLRDRFGEWASAYNNAERDALASMYADEPTTLVARPAGRWLGWGQVNQGIRDFYTAIDYTNMAAQGVEYNVLGPTTAVVTFRHSTTTDATSGRSVAAGDGLQIWTKDAEGIWKIQYELVSERSVVRG